MKVLKKIVCIICAFILTTSCGACQKKGSALDFYYFNTVIHVETYSSTITESEKKQLDNLFLLLENEFDYEKQDSFTHKFNEAAANSKIHLNIHSKTIIDKCLEYYTFTNGKFNPGIYPLLSLWQFSPNFPVTDFSIPDELDVDTLLSTTKKFKNVIISSDGTSVSKTDDKLKIDLGGIVKGYAADLVAELLTKNGHKDGYINVGGSSLNLIKVESLTVKHPRPTNEALNILSINLEGKANVSVSTSGDYERYYVKDGVRYSHLIDPTSGYPTQTNVTSVTVLCDSGIFSDAVTTAACLIEHDTNDLSKSELVQFLRKIIDFNGAAVFAIYDDGIIKQILTNEKQDKSFTLLDKSYSIINI